MSTQSNLFSQGGGGSAFESETHAAFFTSFLIGCSVPGTENGKIIKYRQQSGSLGYQTDDLYLETQDSFTSVIQKQLIQIKHGLVISENSEVWSVVVKAFWGDFNNTTLFDKSKDKLIVIKSDLTGREKKHLKVMLSWAKVKTNEADFTGEVTRLKNKLDYYNEFRTILVKQGVTPTVGDLFQFFKCLEILEYDFGDTASQSRTSFLHLIELSKNNDAGKSALDIWKDIFSFVSGTVYKGGEFERNSIPAHLSSLFDSSYFPPIEKQLQKLSSQSLEIVHNIRNHIGNVVLSRNELVDAAIEKIGTSKIHILTGDPGSGKSVIAREVISSTGQLNGHLIAFKADELLNGNLADILRHKGFSLTIKEFFNHLPLTATHIIYIDGLEKLLEGTADAFKELLTAIENLKHIRLLVSCRSSNFGMLEFKFFSEYNFARQTIPILSEEEVKQVIEAIPSLQPISQNAQLVKLIRIPKYLDFAQRAIKITGKDFADTAVSDFIEILWDIIVKNTPSGNTGGLPVKREASFISVAIERAQKMLAYAQANNTDAEAMQKLVDDEILLRSGDGWFAPAHDVLEDWALVKFVNTCYLEKNDTVDFFAKLSAQPAMRRSYRLWVQNALDKNDSVKIDFFSENFANNKVERYWKDESLIAILHSFNSRLFFDRNITILQDKDWQLFFYVLDLLRMACREKSTLYSHEKIYLPVGPAWAILTGYINRHKDSFAPSRYETLLQVLEDWSNYLSSGGYDPAETRDAGLTALFLLEHYRGNAQYPYNDPKVMRCLSIVYNCSSGIKKELKELFDKAMTFDDLYDRGGNWIETRYYQKIISLTLDGMVSGQLARSFPDFLIANANRRWFPREIVGMVPWERIHSRHDTDGVYHQFGMSDESDHIAQSESAYRTMAMPLLRYQPVAAIAFIVDLTNRITDNYVALNHEHRNELVYGITLPDGTSKEVMGAQGFFSAFRQSTGFPNVVGSVLMALERYLLDLGETNESLFRATLEELYTKSHSLLITGVLSSVCQAHPEAAGEWVLPLLTQKHFYYLDVGRYTNDLLDPSFYISDDIYQRERSDANKRPHRTRYRPGLKGFIIDLELYIHGLDEKIFAIVDKLREEADKDDVEWHRMLDEIDLRTWRPQSNITTDDGKQAAILMPVYHEDIVEKVIRTHESITNDPNPGDVSWVMQVLEGKENNSYQRWLNIYDRYTALPKFNEFDHAPGTLAGIGIRDLWSELNASQKQWSAKRLFDDISQVVKKSQEIGMSTIDAKAATQLFPLLFHHDDCGIETTVLQELLVHALVKKTIYDNTHTTILTSIGKYYWAADTAGALKTWRKLVRYAAHLKKDIGKQSFSWASISEDKIDMAAITGESHEFWLLSKAIRILPHKQPGEEAAEFINRMIGLYAESQAKQSDRRTEDRNNENTLHLRAALMDTFPNIILQNPDEEGKTILTAYFERVADKDFITNSLAYGNDSFTFFRQLLVSLIGNTDRIVASGNDHESRQATENLIVCWKLYDTLLTGKGSTIFSDVLLLNTEWYKGTTHWKPLELMTDMMYELLKKYATINIQAIVNLFCFPGNRLFMPQGLKLLVPLLQHSRIPLRHYKHIEQLIYAAYSRDLTTIREDKQLMADYLWLLDQLVMENSSDAYWIREYVITFRNHPS